MSLTLFRRPAAGGGADGEDADGAQAADACDGAQAPQPQAAAQAAAQAAVRTVDVEDVAGLIVPNWLLLRLPCCDQLPCDQPGHGAGGDGGQGGRRGGGTEAEALQEALALLTA